MAIISYLYSVFVAPRTSEEVLRRREFILNVILLTSMALQLIILGYVAYVRLWVGDVALELYPFVSLFGLFLFYYVLCRLGFVRIVSYALIATYFFTVTITAVQFDSFDPATVFGYAIIPVVAGVFINRRGALLAAAGSLLSLVLVYYFVEYYFGAFVVWMPITLDAFEMLQYGMLLGVVMIMAWMSNHDIKHFLRKGGSLEVVMLTEDDGVIRQVEVNELGNLYRFAEFGRLAGGLFHDMANPLTALLLYLEKVRPQLEQLEQREVLRVSLDKILQIGKRLEEFVQHVREHAGKDSGEVDFAAEDEVVQAAQVFLHKMQRSGVSVKVQTGQGVVLYGSPLKFYQVVLNLISNAIDSYGVLSVRHGAKAVVEVRLVEHGGSAVLSVVDRGGGIAPELLPNIFQPFFTTKGMHGNGIGLATTKDIVERHFHGEIRVSSDQKNGTVFTVRIPLRD